MRNICRLGLGFFLPTLLLISCGNDQNIEKNAKTKLLELISTNKKVVSFGKIDLKGVYTFFEVENEFADKVQQEFSKNIEFQGRPVRVELAGDRGLEGGGGGGNRPRGGGGYGGKRDGGGGGYRGNSGGYRGNSGGSGRREGGSGYGGGGRREGGSSYGGGNREGGGGGGFRDFSGKTREERSSRKRR